MSASIIYLTLTPRDPLIARDGRPFSAGIRMKSLDWFYPSVLAGSLRTLLGQKQGGFPPQGSDEYSRLVQSLKQVECAGPFPCVMRDGKPPELYSPRPADFVVRKKGGRLQGFPVRPWDLDQERVDVIYRRPLACDSESRGREGRVQTSPVPAFWSRSQMISWLADATGTSFRTRTRWGDGYLDAPCKEERTHVKMSYDSVPGKMATSFRRRASSSRNFLVRIKRKNA